MKKGFIVSLLTVALLSASVAAWAAKATPRAASNIYGWVTLDDTTEVPIYRISNCSRASSQVLVYVNGTDGSVGILLNGCGNKHDIFVGQGQTVRCKVKQCHPLNARSAGNYGEQGTIQLINI